MKDKIEKLEKDILDSVSLKLKNIENWRPIPTTNIPTEAYKIYDRKISITLFVVGKTINIKNNREDVEVHIYLDDKKFSLLEEQIKLITNTYLMKKKINELEFIKESLNTKLEE